MTSLLHRLPFSPRTRPLHAITYLLGVPLCSIAFLVFLNSSLSFLLTNLFHTPTKKLGSITGTLGFVDELVAVIAAPLWGVISDSRLGTRGVSVVGYVAIAVSLVISAEVRSVYPGLIVGRVMFSLGAAAVTTMVSAILPEMVSPAVEGSQSQSQSQPPLQEDEEHPPTGKLAGLVGLFTGLGALLALGVLLPLPTRFSKHENITPGDAIRISYFIVAGLAALLAIVCRVGLPPPQNPSRTNTWQDIKTWAWTKIWGGDPAFLDHHNSEDPDHDVSPAPTGIKGFWEALKLGGKDGRIAVAYIGGFVARATSVGISLFIPLFVNHYFISSGKCQPSLDPSRTKDECKKAYFLASTLTGTSQLTALLLAPIYGYLSDRASAVPYLRNLPILGSAILGVLGFTLFSLLPKPSGVWAFVFAALTGANQIGTIVVSLGLLGKGIHDSSPSPLSSENQPLLSGSTSKLAQREREKFKGAVAGVYSLAGAGAILLLTKLGGWMFDAVHVGAPFWLLAGFNGALAIVAGVDVIGVLLGWWR